MKRENGKTAGGLFARARARMSAFEERNDERRAIRCRCSDSGEFFQAIFVRRKDSGLFVFEETRKVSNGKAAGKAGRGSERPIDIREFDYGELTCPYCGSDGFIKCGRCKCFVCDLASERRDGSNYFRCAESCGSAGPTTELKTIEASKSAGPGPLQLTRQPSLLRITGPR